MELADDPRADGRGLSRVEQVVGGPLEARLGLERRVERLDDALRAAPAALDDPGDVAPLVREAVSRQVDARDLEQRDPARSELDVVLAQPSTRLGQEARAQDRELERDRLGQAQRLRIGVVLPQRRRVGLDEPEADERRPRPCGAAAAAGVSAPNISRRRGSVNGTSSRRKRAISSTTSISRVTSRARQVGTITSSPRGSKPSRPRIAACSAAGVARPITSSARSGR